MKNIFLLAFVALIMFGCNSKTSIEGKIEQMPEQKFRLEELTIDANVPVDSGKTKADGTFKLSIKAGEESLYRLRFAQGKYMMLALKNGDDAKISGDWNSLENYQVSGSNGSAALKGFLVNLRENINDLRTMQTILDSLKARPQGDSIQNSAEADMRKINTQFMNYVKQFSDTTSSVASALFAVNMINPAFEQPYITQFYQNIGKRFPKSNNAKAFAKKFLGNGNEVQSEQHGDVSIGNPAPDFVAITPEGTTLQLSSFKGKYILVDFWASWCAPCRQENPNVVKAYDSLKFKNFDIIGVSLDTDKEKWIQAIAKDKLAWKHVSELKGWESSIARNYGVEGIPMNFLIDPQGSIIAKGLRGDDILKKINELMK